MGQFRADADREVSAPTVPPRLEELLADFEPLERDERMEMLIDWADRFTEVPPDVASRPFPERSRAPRCESDAYVFATDRPDGTLQLHFAVENPQGLSAKAWAAILDDVASGAPLEQVAAIDPESIYRIFGRDLSMGKGQGLLGMLELVQFEARRRLRGS
jgi:cysteine desulfuration protein SufE